VEDDHLRSACFASLDVLCAQFGEDVPYKGGLDRGFPFAGRRIPFLSPQKGIFHAAVQRGPEALSINTSAKSPYDDEELPNGFFYAYRAGSPDQPDNRALRSARASHAPLVYFVATRPGWYRPLYPVYVIEDDPVARRVLVTPGCMVGPLDEPEPVLVDDPLERRYASEKLASGCTKLASAGAFLSRTRACVPSAGSKRRGCSMQRTSLATSNGRVSPSSRTVSASARSITAPSIRISSAFRPITPCESHDGCRRMRTARCWSSSRAFIDSRSPCRPSEPGSPTASA
jgi:hypothetical protein